ncbi:MAG: CRISPR-associated endonuclease Cas2 [Caldilineaceae bacterium]|nr:CRISPR-associated endonuclease Cas2 [Caldilineaceae bacterium]
MYCLLIYDITDDPARGKVADACMDYGLDRIQYSAFYGQLSRNHQEELMLKIGKLLRKKSGRVQLIPVAQNEWERKLEVIVDAG